MWVHPQFDPVALQLGPIAIHWYGLSYLAAFGLFFFLMRRRMALPSMQAQGWSAKDLDDILFLGVLGVIFGGRLGYVLFYKPDVYLANPALILKVWEGGMSFHGGLLGVIAGLAWFAYSRKRSFWQVTDIVAPCVPTGIFTVRMGNFINGELFGRVAGPDVPWAMVFKGGGPLARHPSQIYQALTEGLLLFVLLWWFARKPRPLGQVSGLFLVGYGAMRFMIEFFREPDDFLGLRWLQLSQGQWLCIPMVLTGLAIMAWSQSKQGRA